MLKSLYIRPTKTDASKLGERRRHYWSRLLREKALWFLPIIDMMTAEENLSNSHRPAPAKAFAAPREFINVLEFHHHHHGECIPYVSRFLSRDGR